MSAVTDDDVEYVRALVAAIPVGQVSTYGDLAAAAQLSSPRIVGAIMRTDAADLPWHRVVPASGRPAPHLADRQLAALRGEGVPIRDGRVLLRECRWDVTHLGASHQQSDDVDDPHESR
ncbi:MAG: MGMT family protein [Gordonia sp. (in: high G+C Gram-positive bacteria)]